MDGGVVTYIRIKGTGERPKFTQRHIKVGSKAFHADGIFYGADQEKLFQTISQGVLERGLRGYNCTVFAYGQTGSGKTYTIQGTEEAPGIIPRALNYLHDRVEKLKISFVEIYNETMTDLLDPKSNLSIREDPNEGVVVDNLTITESMSLKESLEAYKHGVNNKRKASTRMNENSSRSHTVFTVYIEQREKGLLKRSRLSLVDLAGSERLRDSEPERAKETCNINVSLLCLGKIVNKLSSRDRWHVSYRDSKLTFLLKDSLGGNCCLAIIGNVSLEHEVETLNTLHFLHRSKMICNSPSLNYDTAGCSTEDLTNSIRELAKENQMLIDELTRLKTQTVLSSSLSLSYSIKKIREDILCIEEIFTELRKTYSASLQMYFDANRSDIDYLLQQLQKTDDAVSEETSSKRQKKGE